MTHTFDTATNTVTDMVNVEHEVNIMQECRVPFLGVSGRYSWSSWEWKVI